MTKIRSVLSLCSFFWLLLSPLMAGVAEEAQPDNLGGGSGATYYVDANTGNDSRSGRSESQAWRSLQKAMDTLRPGETVLIKNGDYHGAASGRPYKNWQIRNSGTPGNYITYRAYPGHKPRLHVDTWNGLEIYNASYIEIDGLEIVGLPDPASIVGRPENHSSRIAMKDDPRYFGGGISIVGNSGCHHLRIRNCEVHSVGGNGIGVGNATIVLIEGNTVYNCSHRSDAGNSGISANNLYDHIANPSNYGLAIIGNTCFDNRNYLDFKYYNPKQITDGNGIILDYLNGSRNGAGYRHRSLVANNLVYNNGGRAIHVYNSAHIDIVNNTCWQNLQSADLTVVEGELSAIFNSSDIHFSNNIAVARSGVKAYNVSASGSFRFNHVLSNRSDQASVDGSNVRSGDVRLENPRANSRNPADFQLRADSPAIDSASSVSELRSDFFGVMRPQGGGLDKGAFEAVVSAPPPPPPAPITYALSVGQGSGDGQYEVGTIVSLQANAAPSGQEFAAWTGDTAGIADLQAASTTLTMPERDVSVQATYRDLPAPPSPPSTPPTGLREPDNPSATLPGVNYHYYEGSWSQLPAFESLTPASVGTQPDFDLLRHASRKDDFGFVFSGYIEVPVDGTYTFSTASDDGSKLYIGTVEVVDNDGLHGLVEVAGTIDLKAGKHAFNLQYFERAGGQRLFLYWSGPGFSRQALPVSVLSHLDVSGGTPPPPPPAPTPTYVLQVTQGSGDGDYEAGSIVGVVADLAPAGQAFDGWSGDTQVLANAGAASTTVTMPSAAVALTATYRDLPVAPPPPPPPAPSPAPGLRPADAVSDAVPGLDYAYYEGAWSQLPDFEALTAVKRGEQEGYELWRNAEQKDHYGFVFTGYVEVPADGEYTFYLASDDGSRLYLGGAELVDNDGLHGSYVEESGTLGLQAGKHAIRLEYFENAGGQRLYLRWSGPGVPKQDVPVSALFRSEAGVSPPPVPEPQPEPPTPEPLSYQLTVQAGSGDGAYEAGTVLAIQADAAPAGQTFDRWSGDTAGVGNVDEASTQYTMPAADVTLRATYKDLPVAPPPPPPDPPAPGLRPAENVQGAPGVRYRYFEGSWVLLPDFDAMTPLGTGSQEDLSLLRNNQSKDNFGFSFEGYLEVPSDGTYTLSLASDDGSKLYIGSELLIDNDGLHGVSEVSNSIGLQAGKHSFRLDYFENVGGQRLYLYIEGPGMPKQLVTADRLSH